jgi:hypothetical protein
VIFVYRPQGSQSARLLSEAVDGIRIKREENLRRRVRPHDKVVMWGAYLPNLQGKVLNNVPLTSKFEDAVRLKEAGVRTVEVARTRPVVVPPAPVVDPLLAIWDEAVDAAEAFVQLVPNRNDITKQGLDELVRKITATRRAVDVPAPVPPPVVPVGEWLARRNNHVGGNDLRAGIDVGDFYSKKEAFVNEYRVHSFFGRSIRAGKKVHRPNTGETAFIGTPHPWIRSYDSGWMISYADDFAPGNRKQEIRNIAHAAVNALGLNFGAVDIGELADGTLVVLEVNRAPGVEGGTIEAYARTVRRWIAGEWQPE